MANDILDFIGRLRDRTRSATVLFAIAASIGLVLLPVAYRGGAAPAWVLIAPTLGYFGLASFRLLGGFQAERQLEFEERFVRFAASRNSLLASAQGSGKLWKLSCLVQGLARAEAGAVPDARRREYILRALRSAGRLLLPPAVGLAVPFAAVLGVAWVSVGWLNAGSVGSWVFLIVIPALVAIGWIEYRLIDRRLDLEDGVDHLLARVAEWGASEWGPYREYRSVRPYRHRMYYLDSMIRAAVPQKEKGGARDGRRPPEHRGP